MTSEDVRGTDPPASPATASTPAVSSTTAPLADLDHLVHRRDLSVPDEDRAPLREYWAHIRQLRAAVDERLLADGEIAVTWTPAVKPDAR